MGEGQGSPRASTKRSPRFSPRDDRSATETSPDEVSGRAELAGILKPTSVSVSRPSSGSGSRSPRSRKSQRSSMMSISDESPSIHFADDAGKKLAENHFVQNLHYSEASLHTHGAPGGDGCCTLV